MKLLSRLFGVKDRTLSGWTRLVFPAALTLVLAGCASPGPPQPPSLHLPDKVTNLRADRIGDAVILHWTNPTNTTDGQAIHTPMTAVLCREEASTKPAACNPFQRVGAIPGAATLTQTLSSSLLTDPPILLGYRIELLNAKGRSAGRSVPAYAASGAVPPAVSGLRALGRRRGVQIEWDKPVSGDAPVVLHRTLVTPAAPAPAKAAPTLGGRPAPPAEVLLSTGDADTGGVVDRTTHADNTYRYTAERVRTITLEGHKLELRSVPSAPVEFTVRDVFAPRVPTGLAAVPGTGGSIDLSWQPGAEEDLAGYKVYRRTGANGPWTPLTPSAIEQTAFHDAAIAPGGHYFYRITAVDETGNESKPGNEIEESPAP